MQPLIYSAAAILLVGLTSGILLIEDSVNTSTPNQFGETASIGNSGNQLYSRPASSALDNNERLEPWVDKNEVLYFREQRASQNSMLDSIRTASLDKLTPVDPTNNIQRQQQLQLTGSQN